MEDRQDHSFNKLTVPKMSPDERKKFLETYEEEFKEAFGPEPTASEKSKPASSDKATS